MINAGLRLARMSAMRFRPQLLCLALLLAVAGPAASSTSRQTPAPLANAIVLIVRHAEKPAEGDELTTAGTARAQAYARYFQNLKIDGKPFRVDHIFAAADSKNSHRPRLTVEPLGQALKLSVDVRFKNKDYEGLVSDLKTHPYGKDIVVCWHHGNIPKLLAAFGAPASLVPGGKWPEATYDWMIELKFDSDGKVIPTESKRIAEHLMPGDSK